MEGWGAGPLQTGAGSSTCSGIRAACGLKMLGLRRGSECSRNVSLGDPRAQEHESIWGEREGHPIDINWVQELQRHSLGALAQRLPAWVALCGLESSSLSEGRAPNRRAGLNWGQGQVVDIAHGVLASNT